MPGTEGWTSWDEPFIFDKPWLDDAYLVEPMELLDGRDAIGLLALETHEGTHKLQRIFRGTKAPAVYDAMEFTFSPSMIAEEDYYRLRRVIKSGEPFWWSQGMRIVEVFDAVSGQTYTLTRPLANGVVTAVDETSHPTVIRLDGVVDAGAATISGSPKQTVAANSTGEIAIEYTPVHRVIATEFPALLSAHNVLESPITLTEIVQGSF